jgi:hypothetical protein
VTAIVFAPTEAGVYLNVAEGAPVVRLTVVGVNVPPPAPALGVTVTGPGTEVPATSATVKFVESAPVSPELGPDNVYVVAYAAVKVIAAGSISPLLLVALIVFAPADGAMYVNVTEGAAVVSPTLLGVKVPPAPPSLGVTITEPATVVCKGK